MSPNQTKKRAERCVICGHPEDRHGKDGLCVGSAGAVGSKFSTLNLPEGKTCADCVHTATCVAIFNVTPQDERCDFFPIRYREREGEYKP